MLGVDTKALKVNDLAVNPASGKAYLSVSRGQGADAMPVLLRVDRKNNIEEVSLKDVPFAKATIPNASTKSRQESITCMAYVKGKLFVAGLSNEDFASTLRAIPFPFSDVDKGTSVEIFHGSHGKYETGAPVRTFVPYDVKGETNILAAYTCTPLVKFPVTQLEPGKKVQGTTIAELGNGNRPLDMIIYQKGGKDFILMANSKHGVLKVPTEGIDKIDAITKPVSGTAGLVAEPIKDLKGVVQLDLLDKDNALVLMQTDKGLTLDTVALP